MDPREETLRHGRGDRMRGSVSKKEEGRGPVTRQLITLRY